MLREILDKLRNGNKVVFFECTNHSIFQLLEPRTPYEVMVLGFTGEGDGEAATLSIHTAENESSSQSESTPPLPGHAPDPPVGLEAEPISSSAIRLSWAHGSDVAFYTVCYNPVQTSLSVDEKSIQCLKRLVFFYQIIFCRRLGEVDPGSSRVQKTLGMSRFSGPKQYQLVATY